MQVPVIVHLPGIPGNNKYSEGNYYGKKFNKGVEKYITVLLTKIENKNKTANREYCPVIASK